LNLNQMKVRNLLAYLVRRISFYRYMFY